MLSLTGGWIERRPGSSFGLEYADDIVQLSEDAQKTQRVLDGLATEVSRYGMCFAPSKYNIFFETFIHHGGDQLEVASSPKNFGSWITVGGGAAEETPSWTE